MVKTNLLATHNETPDLAQALSIGSGEIRNRVFLAPMSGITDLPFRQLASKFGAGGVVSEMVASEALVDGVIEMRMKAQFRGLGTPIVQLAGREAHWMRLAAQMAEANGAQIIDINMGCPARRVTTGACGSALMRDLDHALRLIDAIVGAVAIPVTLKMRLGWDERSLNAPELACRAEAAGVAMITVHGRTRCQFYKGKANWPAVARVREAVKIPLVINGDIHDRQSAHRALSDSGADAVMIGRAAYGAPWLAGFVAGESSAGVHALGAPENLSDLIGEHYEAMLMFYGERDGLRKARKHLSWYLDRHTQSTDPLLRKEILTSCSPSGVLRGMRLALGGPVTAVAA